MISTEESQVLQRLSQLENAIIAGFNDLNQKLANALLEQERRNSTFATRDRLEELNRKVDGVTQAITAIGQRDDASVEERKMLHTRLDALAAAQSSRSLDQMKAVTGLLASTLAVILAAVVTFALSHGIH